MALITCPECSRQVSDKASSCPGCGYPITTQPVIRPARPRSQGEDSFVSLLGQAAKNIAEDTTAEDVKRFFCSRGKGLAQLILCLIMGIILISIGAYYMLFIPVIFGIRGIYVMFTGDESQLER